MYSAHQIPKRANEDRYCITQNHRFRWFAVFDGHGGPHRMSPTHCADYATCNLANLIFDRVGKLDLTTISAVEAHDAVINEIQKIFVELDTAMYERKLEYGTTCTALLVDDLRNVIYQINLGDSRSMIFHEEMIVSSTIDHEPLNPTEKERIYRAGGYIAANRVNGTLMVSRAFGDFSYKQTCDTTNFDTPSTWTIVDYDPVNGPVSAVPEIEVIPKLPGMQVLLTSDAPYENDAWTDQKLVSEVNKLRSKNKEGVAEILCNKIWPTTTDDITIIHVVL